jgi:hypothetical protein
MKCERINIKENNSLQKETPFLATSTLINSEDVLLIKSIETSKKGFDIHVVIVWSKTPNQLGHSFCVCTEDLNSISKYNGIIKLSNELGTI